MAASLVVVQPTVAHAARAPKPALLTTDGTWGAKTQAAFDYVVGTSKYSNGVVTTSAATALAKLNDTESIAFQKYLNHSYTDWKMYYDGTLWSPKVLSAQLNPDGNIGSLTHNAFLNYLAYCIGCLTSFYAGPDISGEYLTQWEVPSVRYYQEWLNAAIARKTIRQLRGGGGGHVPYLP